jgi:hypothetical protein
MDSKFQDDAIEAWLCFVCAVVICTFAALLLILSALYSFSILLGLYHHVFSLFHCCDCPDCHNVTQINVLLCSEYGC